MDHRLALAAGAHFTVDAHDALHLAGACAAAPCAPDATVAVPTAVGQVRVWLPSVRTR